MIEANGTTVHRDREDLHPVSRSNPCPVCQKDHKCSVGDGGLILCGRCDHDVDGFVHLGAAKDPTWHLYRRADATGSPPHAATERRSVRRISQSAPDWARRHEEYRTAFPGMRDELEESLRVPGWALDAVGYGWSENDRNYTAAERDGSGRVVGIHRRLTDGRKLFEAGGNRGLIIPDGFPGTGGTILSVEGASGTAACVAAGIMAVGRPSNTGGVDQLAVLLKTLPADRQLVIVGDNDQKEDGCWPGKEGAEGTAKRLSQALGRPVHFAFPPDGVKDSRDWLVARVGSDAGNAAWAEAGREYFRELSKTASRLRGGPTARASRRLRSPARVN